MSRSVHTRPRPLIAARRVRAPYAPRSTEDRRAAWARSASPGSRGVSELLDSPDPAETRPAPLPRLRARRPRLGYIHPAGPADIARVLRFFGERCTYGLRSVELARGIWSGTAPGPRLGRLFVPGRIVLYDQALPPWRVRGSLQPAMRNKLVRAGAMMTTVGAIHTIVEWPDDTLRDFMLFDVLMHEVGHHLIQQYKGKRVARVARTRDHEAFADLFARRCREQYQGRVGA